MENRLDEALWYCRMTQSQRIWYQIRCREEQLERALILASPLSEFTKRKWR